MKINYAKPCTIFDKIFQGHSGDTTLNEKVFKKLCTTFEEEKFRSRSIFYVNYPSISSRVIHLKVIRISCTPWRFKFSPNSDTTRNRSQERSGALPPGILLAPGRPPLPIRHPAKAKWINIRMMDLPRGDYYTFHFFQFQIWLYSVLRAPPLSS